MIDSDFERFSADHKGRLRRGLGLKDGSPPRVEAVGCQGWKPDHPPPSVHDNPSRPGQAIRPHADARGTSRGTDHPEIPRFWVQREQFGVASVQVAAPRHGSMLLVSGRRSSQLVIRCQIEPCRQARTSCSPASAMYPAARRACSSPCSQAPRTPRACRGVANASTDRCSVAGQGRKPG
jgi:hypothetical protein